MIIESVKVFFLGMLIYISGNLFFKIGSKWFPELRNKNDFETRVAILRKNFWKSVFLNVVVIFGAFYIISWLGLATWNEKIILRMIAIIAALSAALGRGGWEIQSYKGSTIIERIDRGMFKLSQLGAAVFLLIVLTME